MKEKPNIYLIGFMGTGKTSVGRRLAQELGYQFVDADQAIEEKEGMPITEIFATKGEAYFRDLEMAFLESGHAHEGLVVSCGGGIITQPGRLEFMEKAGFLVCLYASADSIWERIKDSAHRPLLQTDNPRETLQKLYDERMPLYQDASTIIMTDHRPARDITLHIVREYKRLLTRRQA